MLLNIINWIYIVAVLFSIGSAALKICDGKKYSIDVIISVGMCLCTIYAETFSIFCKVAAIATLGIISIAVLSLIYARDNIVVALSEAKEKFVGFQKYKKIAIGLIIFLCLILASLTPISADDYGYHIGSIQWINYYGIVKGLGNLHFRFAFNSAFLCLQALFNWEFFLNYPLHGMNALSVCLLFVYCIVFFGDFDGIKTRFKTSDFIRFSYLVYWVYESGSLIGVDTDPLAMIFLMYIFLKCVEIVEIISDKGPEKNREIDNSICYVLGLLSVFSVTLKLSAGALLIFWVAALILIVLKKDIKRLLVYLICSGLITIPFVVRNVILSGYLIFPMESLNILHVDWKIPYEKVVGTLKDIVIWGMSTQNLIGQLSKDEVYNLSLYKAMPIWYTAQLKFWKALIPILIIVGLAGVIRLVLALIKREMIEKYMLFPYFACFICIIFWISSAPAIRFGGVLLLLFAAMSMGVLTGKFIVIRELDELKNNKIDIIYLSVLILFLGWGGLKSLRLDFKSLNPVGASYKYCDMMGEPIESSDKDAEDIIIYYPSETNPGQCSYDYFPTTNSIVNIQNAQLRGSTLGDGFKPYKADVGED